MTKSPITITLGLPPKSLHPNARAHWRVRARDSKEAKHSAAMQLRAIIGSSPTPWASCTLQARFIYGTKRKRDDDNLNAWLKYYRDGFAIAGLVADDNHIKSLPATIHIEKTALIPMVEITLTNTGDPK